MKPVPAALLLLILLYVLVGLMSLVAPLAFLLSGMPRLMDWTQLANCLPFFFVAFCLYRHVGGMRVILLFLAVALVVLALILIVLLALDVAPPDPIDMFGWSLPRRWLILGLGGLLLAVAAAHFVVLLRADVTDYLNEKEKPK